MLCTKRSKVVGRTGRTDRDRHANRVSVPFDRTPRGLSIHPFPQEQWTRARRIHSYPSYAKDKRR